MPNWCNNDVTLSHKDPAMIERALQALARGQFLQEFVPCPEELKDTTAGSFGDPEQQALLVEQTARNIKKYGFGNWYDWCVNNWGTKWDVGGEDGLTQKLNENTLQTSFDSAWAPPCSAYEKLIELGFYVKAYYNEPGMAYCGVWEGDQDNGYSDDYFEYSGHTSETVREAIGEELDDFYSISEQMADWEEEEDLDQ